MSKSKILSALLFCIYIVIALIDSTIISFVYLFFTFIGLVCIWLGEKITPVRLRAGTFPFPRSVTVTGWCILLSPLLRILL